MDEKPPIPPEDPAAAYPPQQPPYPQAAPQETVPTVVVQQQPGQTTVEFRDIPVEITDSRGQQVTTQLDYRNGNGVYIVALLLFLLGFWCLCFIPFLVKGLKDVHHINPTDGSVVGVYKRFGI